MNPKAKTKTPEQQAAERFEQRKQAIDKYKQDNKTCSYCLHTGFILARNILQPLEASYAFRCSKCAISGIMELSEKIKEWDDHYHDRFSMLREY